MFTSIVLGFYALFFLSLSFTIYLYIRLLVAVRQRKDVPKWIYKLGQAVQGRIHVDYEETTDANALKEIHWFLLIYLIVIYSYWLASTIMARAFLKQFMNV